MSLPKLALIHDMCGVGHCSMTVALPIVSIMGIQGCPIPTSIFSNHTGYPEWYKLDITEHLDPYIDVWSRLGVSLDGIYCGYLGSGLQVEAVQKLIAHYPDIPLFLDPVMGDHGKLYSAITPDHIQAMQMLLTHAAYITPNITEACILAGYPYKEHFDLQDLLQITEKLHKMGPSNIVITGLREAASIQNFISYKKNDGFCQESIYTPVAGNSRPGTGDIFASVLISCIIKGQSLPQAAEKAAQFVCDCIQVSDKQKLPICEGTAFELILPTLITPPSA